MRITKRTNIAMCVLMYCAANPNRLVTKHEIAAECNASENHLAQVIHKLALLGFLETQRGRSGGVRLAHKQEDICIGEIFRAIEGPFPVEECCAGTEIGCDHAATERLQDILREAAEAFYTRLDQVTLAALMDATDISAISPS
ncbi:RrF2 family transcriptional regulator [Shimia sp. MMG029]|uniref:RrF2 family transcriptional regulator n=1 Tax=Shimia sp. MMG029 TaxID=3021978 RepID=UPI0022FE1EC1|nr:Rrf2 family transcriptional regulator [Shimia sp. MMG029]MDA5555388.1 Rrf2 family transcriptional regulator [Shimia sp. MMG029]